MPAGGGVSVGLGMALGGLFGSLGAATQADAAQSAAQTQAASGDKAAQLMSDLGNKQLAFQQQQWAQAQENMRPFLGVGRGAAEMMGTAMGITPDYPSQGAQQPLLGGPSTVGSLYGPTAPRLPAPIDAGGGGGRHGVAGAVSVHGGRQAMDAQAAPQPSGQQTPDGQPMPAQNRTGYGAQTVHIKWPSGQEQDVPAYQAAQYTALGATVEEGTT